jgi:hypothetical protein
MTASAPIEVRPVRGWRERRTFLTFPWRVYRDDPLWVPPLLPDRAKAIDPERGAFFKRGEADFFIAWRGDRPVGTICAAEDYHTNDFTGQKDCVFGFFEYLPDYEVFEALLRAAQGWGQARGLNALFGPFNLDYEDSYGVLIEGRDRPPALFPRARTTLPLPSTSRTRNPPGTSSPASQTTFAPASSLSSALPTWTTGTLRSRTSFT